MSFLLPYLNTTIVGVGVSVILLFFSYFILQSTSKAKNPPVASGKWPIIGHLYLLASSKKLPHFTLDALSDNYGSVFTIFLGMKPALVVSSWEVAKELFTKNDVALSSRPVLTSGKHMGYNYADFGFAPYGAYWREMRKIAAMELFSARKLELLKHDRASDVQGEIKEIYKLWNKKTNESKSSHVLVDMQKRFGDLNLNVILMMVAGKRYFGDSSEVNEDEARRCKKVTREFFRLTGVFMAKDVIPLPFLGLLDIGGYEKAMKASAKEMDSLVEEWLKEHRRKKESGETPAKEGQDFIDVLLSVINDGITDISGFHVDTVIKSAASGLISGGVDPTTVNLTWTISLLLNNPHVLKKVQEELDTVVGKERLMNASDMDKLVYLQAVVKETLRFWPVTPVIAAREFNEDCTVTGYHVAKGTRLMLNVWKMHRDPRVWSDPLEYRPERFLTTHKNFDVKGQNFELLPFGAGRRSCPGMNFGLQMTHLVLGCLLHAFDIAKPSNELIDMTGSVGMTNNKVIPLEVLLKPRLSSHLYE